MHYHKTQQVTLSPVQYIPVDQLNTKYCLRRSISSNSSSNSNSVCSSSSSNSSSD